MGRPVLQFANLNKAKKERTETLMKKACNLSRVFMHNPSLDGRVFLGVQYDGAYQVFLSDDRGSWPVNFSALGPHNVKYISDIRTEKQAKEDAEGVISNNEDSETEGWILTPPRRDRSRVNNKPYRDVISSSSKVSHSSATSDDSSITLDHDTPNVDSSPEAPIIAPRSLVLRSRTRKIMPAHNKPKRVLPVPSAFPRFFS